MDETSGRATEHKLSLSYNMIENNVCTSDRWWTALSHHNQETTGNIHGWDYGCCTWKVETTKETRDADQGRIIVFMETWLNPSIPDSAIVPEALFTHHQDRAIESGKSKGGGVCFVQPVVLRCGDNFYGLRTEAAFILAGDFNANLKKICKSDHISQTQTGQTMMRTIHGGPFSQTHYNIHRHSHWLHWQMY